MTSALDNPLRAALLERAMFIIRRDYPASHYGWPGQKGGSLPRDAGDRTPDKVPKEATGGTCYETAATWLMEHGPKHQGMDVRMAHGTVVGQGRIAGIRYGHAWIELGDALVYDTEHQKMLYKELYYRVGQISDVKTYTRDETLAKMLETEHYGPWEGEWVPKRSYEGHCGREGEQGGSVSRGACASAGTSSGADQSLATLRQNDEVSTTRGKLPHGQ